MNAKPCILAQDIQKQAEKYSKQNEREFRHARQNKKNLMFKYPCLAEQIELNEIKHPCP